MALKREEKELIVKKFGTSEQDTGSVGVQVALLTKNITMLTDHCKQYPKDFSSKRGLLKMVCHRRRLLEYLKRIDSAKYHTVIKQLELRK